MRLLLSKIKSVNKTLLTNPQNYSSQMKNMFLSKNYCLSAHGIMSQSYTSLSESDNDSDSGRSCSASSLYSKCLVGFVELKN